MERTMLFRIQTALSYVPKDESRGYFEDKRGESKFIPSEDNDEGKACKEKLKEYGLDGIEYKNLEPDFSECSEATVKIDNMTENRPKNFSQADKKAAELWNKQKRDNRTDWTEEKVHDYRHENKLSWHERCDTQTMDLVPREIHEYCKYLGGVSECRVRDNTNAGGGFDE